MGTTVGKELTGTIGDIGFSSFNVAKPLQGIYGGVVFGKDKKRTDLIRSIINDSAEASKISIKEVVRSLGGVLLSRTIFWPALMYVTSLPKVQKMFVYYYRVAENKQMIIRKMSPYLAFIVRANIPSFRKRIAQRQEVASSYVKKLSKYMAFQKNNAKSIANGYMVVANFPGNTLKLRRYLALRGIDIAVKDEVADDCLGRSGSNTKNLVNHLISLPVYESLKEGDINRVCKSILSFVVKH
jgi:dTDP-4-amino-4,6-dideoxygalactose transaminase